MPRRVKRSCMAAWFLILRDRNLGFGESCCPVLIVFYELLDKKVNRVAVILLLCLLMRV